MDTQVLQAPPIHRTNRRRERPGARTRHALSHKNGLGHEVSEGIELARDSYTLPPFNRSTPSPLHRQTFEQSWQRWKTREAEQKPRAASTSAQLENDQRRLFGGDVNDDKLRRLGILYESNKDNLPDSRLIPQESLDAFVTNISTRNRGRQRQRSNRTQVPLFLSSSFLSQDKEIMSLVASHSATSYDAPSNLSYAERSRSRTPQSLPSPRDPSARAISSPLLFPLAGDDEELADATWTIISSIPSTPSLEPEMWVDLGDDL